MKIAELLPLVRKAEELKGLRGGHDIYEHIRSAAAKAANGFEAKQLCREVISLCHPRAWGDRMVEGFEDNIAWVRYLGTVWAVAEECGEAIVRREQREGGGIP